MPRIDKKENMQLAIKKMMATMVTSSIIVFSDLSSNFNEVSTIKHMPSKLEDAFKICGDFSFCPFTSIYFELEEAVRLQVKTLPSSINTVIELLFNQYPVTSLYLYSSHHLPLYTRYFHNKIFSVGAGRRLVAWLVITVQYFFCYQ